MVILCLLSINTMQGQTNLVPNPSFENTVGCPSGDNRLQDYLTNWFNCRGSPDYFNNCRNTVLYSVHIPSNSWGYQYPHSGNSYIGLIGTIPPNGNNGDELAECALTETLKNQLYCVEFYVSLGDSCGYAISDICAYFSDTLIYDARDSLGNLIPFTPQVCNDVNTPIVDKVNWTKISGTFLAKGGEKYILIGNFSTNGSTHSVPVSGAGGIGVRNEAYYYIDDVSVVALTVDSIKIDAGKDTTICKGDSVVIGSTFISNYIYHWTPATGLDDTTKQQPVASPTATTTYVLTVTDTSNASCKYIVSKTDTIVITVKDCTPPPQLFTINISPSPNNGTFTLQYNLSAAGSLRITDVLGREVYVYNLLNRSGQETISLPLSQGIYFWQVLQEHSVSAMGKLVIIK